MITLLQNFRLLSDCWQPQQRLINEQWQERWLPARERHSWDLDSPEAKDKGGKGKAVTTQLKLSPLLCLDNLHECRKCDHFAWINCNAAFHHFLPHFMPWLPNWLSNIKDNLQGKTSYFKLVLQICSLWSDIWRIFMRHFNLVLFSEEWNWMVLKIIIFFSFLSIKFYYIQLAGMISSGFTYRHVWGLRRSSKAINGARSFFFFS